MSKDIAWETLKRIVPEKWVRKKHEGDLTLTLINDSRIELKGAENYDSLRGRALSGAVLDECAFLPEDAWRSVIRPALSDRLGWGLFTTTPSPEGTSGWFYELILLLTDPDMANPDLQRLNPEQWVLYEYTSLQGGNIPPQEIEEARRTLAPEVFQREYEAKLISSAGLVCSCFSMSNLDSSVEEDPRLPVYIGIDFNNDPLTAICAQIVRREDGEKELRVFDEILLKNATTWDIADELNDRFGLDRRKIALPDPTGKRRQTSGTGRSDHQILRSAGIQVYAPQAPYNTADKIRAANAALRTEDGEVHTVIHPRCRELIKSFRTLGYAEGTRMPNKKLGVDHAFDAFCYLVLGKFNLARKGAGEGTGHQIY